MVRRRLGRRFELLFIAWCVIFVVPFGFPTPSGGSGLTHIRASLNLASARRDVIRFLLPVGSSDFSVIQAVQNAKAKTVVVLVQTCLHNHGANIMLQWRKQAGPDNLDFPNIGELKARGFDLISRAKSASSKPQVIPSKYRQLYAYCETSVVAPLQPLFTSADSSGGVFTRWLAVLHVLDARILTSKVVSRWRICSRDSKLKFVSLKSWFTAVDGAVTTLLVRGKIRAALHEQVTLGKIFGKCFGPIEDRRVAERKIARKLFEKMNRTILRKLESEGAKELVRSMKLIGWSRL